MSSLLSAGTDVIILPQKYIAFTNTQNTMAFDLDRDFEFLLWFENNKLKVNANHSAKQIDYFTVNGWFVYQ